MKQNIFLTLILTAWFICNVSAAEFESINQQGDLAENNLYAEAPPEELSQHQPELSYGTEQGKISSDIPIGVEYTNAGFPIVFATMNDETLKFTTDESNPKKNWKFPKDFYLEIPEYKIPFYKDRRLDQLTVIGSHNCFANSASGFLYYQQRKNIEEQFRAGARMLRTAWHPPSGSRIDQPNKQAILCHAPDTSKCKTVSLATRGFKKHVLVETELIKIKELLDANQEEIIILGVNNYLTAEESDIEVERVPGLNQIIVTDNDINNTELQKIWGGQWPTVHWMIQNGKRLIIFTDHPTSKFTINSKRYIKMNSYGTSEINKAAQPRGDSADMVQQPLIELSWFQDVSLDPRLMDILDQNISRYQQMKSSVMELKDNLWTRFRNTAKRGLEILRLGGITKKEIDDHITFKDIEDVSQKLDQNRSIFDRFNPFKVILNKFRGIGNGLSEAIKKITGYAPKKQDNSIETLLRLVSACYGTRVIPIGSVPNIIMLDFSTSDGNSIPFANLMNFIVDQRYGPESARPKGFKFNGQIIQVPENIIQSAA